MTGCKSHMETVKDEVLALKNRCQSQYEDLLKLASGLDNLVERFDSQEPKVTKLETDTHCLGMLISDYEQNFNGIEKRLERNDTRSRELERTVQRMDKERDAIRGELRTIGEQANYLSNVKADKLDVQTELNRRALMTDLQLRVPYDVFNDGVRELTRFVTQMREEQYELDENLKTVQYELVKGLDAKASAQDVSQIRKQLVGVLARWQKAERNLQVSTGDTATQLIRGDFHSAAVALTSSLSHSTGSSTCLSCGVRTTIEGTKSAVPVARESIAPGV
uniref:DUF4795 domain-containing protein n=1 Tax=Anopheles atroparvus TaxID=41427 RepID=A0A182J9V6_ANOAO